MTPSWPMLLLEYPGEQAEYAKQVSNYVCSRTRTSFAAIQSHIGHEITMFEDIVRKAFRPSIERYEEPPLDIKQSEG